MTNTNKLNEESLYEIGFRKIRPDAIWDEDNHCPGEEPESFWQDSYGPILFDIYLNPIRVYYSTREKRYADRKQVDVETVEGLQDFIQELLVERVNTWRWRHGENDPDRVIVKIVKS